MNKELALQTIEKELSLPFVHEDVKNHYLKLKEIASRDKNEYDGMKILVFQPISTGDITCSSICAELFQIKYPGCTVDYYIEPHEARDLLFGNPFINDIIVGRNWELVVKRTTLEPGPLASVYDIIYKLYWWDAKPNMITSFLEDLELPTDYKRVRVYTKDYHDKEADELLKNVKKPFIMVQSDIGLRWNKVEKFDQLKAGLSQYGEVIETQGKAITYGVSAALLRQADLYVGSHGSTEHVAAAVGCQTVTLSTVYRPEYVMTPFYQNKYRPLNRQSKIVRPKDWCGDFDRCISHIADSPHYLPPPYGYPARLCPHICKPCDYKDFKKTCIHEITVEEILEVVNQAMKERKNG